jgi:hypothetical protein
MMQLETESDRRRTIRDASGMPFQGRIHQRNPETIPHQHTQSLACVDVDDAMSRATPGVTPE